MKNLQPHQIAQLPNLVIGVVIIFFGFIVINEVNLILGLIVTFIGVIAMFYQSIQEHKETIKKWWRNLPLILGVLFIAFGILDGYTTQLNDAYEGTFQSLKDSAFSRWLHIGVVMIGVVCFFFWAINQAEKKEKAKAEN
jgi:hypothetical protein